MEAKQELRAERRAHSVQCEPRDLSSISFSSCRFFKLLEVQVSIHSSLIIVAAVCTHKRKTILYLRIFVCIEHTTTIPRIPQSPGSWGIAVPSARYRVAARLSVSTRASATAVSCCEREKACEKGLKIRQKKVTIQTSSMRKHKH